MLELIILGGIGYAATWKKGVKFAIWTGVVIVCLILAALGVFLTISVGPLAETAMLFEFLDLFFVFLLEGGLAVWMTILALGFMVTCYAAGIALAVLVKHRKDQAV